MHNASPQCVVYSSTYLHRSVSHTRDAVEGARGGMVVGGVSGEGGGGGEGGRREEGGREVREGGGEGGRREEGGRLGANGEREDGRWDGCSDLHQHPEEEKQGLSL